MEFIYVIGIGQQGPVKLGISKHPERRVQQLQTGQAERLQVFHQEPIVAGRARLFERLIHRDLGYLRNVGEWFNLTVEQAIAQIQYTLIQYSAVDNLAEKVRLRRI